MKLHDIRVPQSSVWASRVVIVVKNLTANAGDIKDMGLIPERRRYTRGGHGNPFQYSCLENPLDRGAWLATGLQQGHKESDMTETTQHKHIPLCNKKG